MRKSILILLIGLMTCGVALAAKSQKHPTLTRKYRNQATEAVIQDIAKRTDWKIVYDAGDIDLRKPVTLELKNASAKSALKKVLGKEFDITSKRGVLTIAPKPQPATTIVRKATEPYAVDSNEEAITRHYKDTTYTIACKKRTVEDVNDNPNPNENENENSNKGHHVQAFVGLGHSGATMQVQYAYYFHENWGVYAGLGFSATNGYKKLGNRSDTLRNTKDSEGEPCDIMTQRTNMRDVYTTHTVDIPIGIQCMYPLSEKAGIYAAAGVKLGVPVYNSYRMSADAENSGYYAYTTHVTIPAGLHDYTSWKEKCSTTDVEHAKIAVMPTLDLGATIKASEKINVLVGAYAQVIANKVFPNADRILYQAGVKVGIDWHQPVKPKKKELPKQYRTIDVCDTTMTLADRDEKEMRPKTEAAKQIKEIMKRSVIWFDLDKTDPKLEPADIIERIAAILIADPSQKIAVNGHASREGNERHNRKLSERRAQAVYDLLLKAGVPEAQMELHSYSAEIDYVDDNANDNPNANHNVALDRRVEIVPIQ